MSRLLTTICILFYACSAIAQGRLLGRVVDENGKPVIAAIVALDGSKKSGAVVTNNDGYYTFLGLPEGRYGVKVSKRGLPSSSSQIALAANSTIMLNLKLIPKATPSQIAKADALKTESKKIKLLPKPNQTEKVNESASSEPTPEIAKEDGATEKNEPVVAESDSSAQNEAVEVTGEIKGAELQTAVAEAEAVELLKKKFVDKEASVQGGIETIYKYLRYPYEAKNTAKEVTIAARVFVGEKGQVIKVDMLKTGSAIFNEEVYRVLTEDVKFSPALLDGKATSGTLTVIVTFKP